MTGQFVFQYCFCYNGVRGNMACKVRASDNQQKFPGERLPAVYVSCGITNLLIPATKLERLKEGMDAFRFSGCVTDRSVIGD
jgi:hypothetical protein